MNDLKEKTEAWNGIATLTYKIGIAIGAIVTLMYMFQISYFPTGLTPGEVVFFVFVALAFGFVSALLLLYGTFSALWLSQLLTHGVRLFRYRDWKPRSSKLGWLSKLQAVCQRKGHQRSFAAISRLIKIRLGATRAAKRDVRLLPKEADHFLLGLCSVFVFLLFLLGYMQTSNRGIEQMLEGAWIAGFTWLFLNGISKKSTNQNTNHIPWLARYLVPLVLFFVFGSPMQLTKKVFEYLGIRSTNVSIEVPDTEREIFESASETLGRPLLGCRKAAAGKMLVHGVDVLWGGIGEQTLISLTATKSAKPGGEKAEVTLSLPTKDVKIIRTKPITNFCFSLPADMSFESGQFTLTKAAQEQLDGLASTIQSNGNPVKILVRGHSDPRPIVGKLAKAVGENQQLSELRAQAVADALQQKLATDKLIVQTEGAGSMEPAASCSSTPTTSKSELEQCHRKNRRIEIHIQLGQNEKLAKS